ncbi:hypothetical protein [Tautonia plasticadhaerens]|nr:hypothetical protein [Tautonia plasticadhaerens]
MTDHLVNLRAHDYSPDWYYYLSSLESDEDRLLAVIEGRDRFLRPFSYHLDYGAGWVDDPDTLIVRFEDLIGPSGGGDADTQVREVARISEFVGGTPTEPKVEEVAASLWGGGLGQ